VDPCTLPDIAGVYLAHVTVAAQIRPEDIAADRVFWRYWGTPLLNAMLNTNGEPEEKTSQGRRISGLCVQAGPAKAPVALNP
jgi:hypothetical protein